MRKNPVAEPGVIRLVKVIGWPPKVPVARLAQFVVGSARFVVVKIL